jgi:hypothetical protein
MHPPLYTYTHQAATAAELEAVTLELASKEPAAQATQTMLNETQQQLEVLKQTAEVSHLTLCL